LGPDSLEFAPERFLGKLHSYDKHFMPFGFGTRSCVGYKFPILAVKIYLCLLLRNHEVVIENFDQELRWTALLGVEKPFPFMVRPVDLASVAVET
jgi:cytochrome P450